KLKIIDFNNLTLDIDFKEENGLLICTNIKDQGAGYNAGIMSGDELIAIDGYRVNSQTYAKRVKSMYIGQNITLTLSRDERMIDKKINVSGSKLDHIKLEKVINPSLEQTNFYNIWLSEYKF
ncbi:MAG: PDZ domain-containing protein, partial [Candidatus Sericytochromatia bacterium]|nr:PDZ domain-containing protein [Candidatus Sericytochromatia bacterium]